MSDPRYRNGAHLSATRTIQPLIDSPLYHGWEPVAINDDGHRIWALGHARMRRVLLRDNLPADKEWIVFIDGQVWTTFTDHLAELTAEVVAELNSERKGNEKLDKNERDICWD